MPLTTTLQELITRLYQCDPALQAIEINSHEYQRSEYNQLPQLLRRYFPNERIDRQESVSRLLLRIFLKLLEINPHVKTLSLQGVIVDEANAQLIVDMLSGNRRLTTIKFVIASITDAGFAILSKLLTALDNLKVFDISQNKLTEASLAILKDALSVNHGLLELGLNGNSINDVGAGILAEVLKTHPQLSALELRGNKITDEGMKLIADALKYNHSLTRLNLYYNRQIAQIGLDALALAMQNNYSLMELVHEQFSVFHTNEALYKTSKAIQDCLDRNQKLARHASRSACRLLPAARWLGRHFLFNQLPIELQAEIFKWVQEIAVLSPPQLRKVMEYAGNKQTLQLDRETFLQSTMTNRYHFFQAPPSDLLFQPPVVKQLSPTFSEEFPEEFYEFNETDMPYTDQVSSPNSRNPNDERQGEERKEVEESKEARREFSEDEEANPSFSSKRLKTTNE